jgi:hypothetical protein
MRMQHGVHVVNQEKGCGGFVRTVVFMNAGVDQRDLPP